jgi:ABC-type multidrug transport system fused ATPase/permease subunit
MKISDRRIHLVNEFITNAKLIKLYNWEWPFTKRILEIREQQNKAVAILAVYGTITRVIGTVGPMVVSLVTFAIYSGLQNNEMDATKVFTALMLFNIMKEPLSKLPESTTLLVKTLISIKRIQDFLLESDFHNNIRHEDAVSKSAKNQSIYSFKKMSCGWAPDENELILRDITLRIPKGKLVFIVGPVGSGKSTLLSTLLGETYIHSGKLESPLSDVSNRVAYCTQQPWILSDSIRNNILFGEEFNLERYISTIVSCALIRDLELLPDGDFSIIGDHDGVGQLSGGQRY